MTTGVTSGSQRRIVVRRWRSARHFFALFAGLVCAAGAVLLVIEDSTLWWQPAVVACIALYYAAAGWINRTSIELRANDLVIRRGPLPALGARVRRLPPLREVAVYYDRNVTPRSVAEVWVLQGVLVDGRRVVLDLCDDPDAANDLQKRIRAAMGEGLTGFGS